MNDTAVTCLIPFRTDSLSNDRESNLFFLLDYMSSHFPHWRYCIVEQDGLSQLKAQSIQRISLDVEHLFLSRGGPFNKSWTLNQKLSQSSSPLIVVMDADILVCPKILTAGIGLLQENKVDSVDFFQTYLWCGPHLSQLIRSGQVSLQSFSHLKTVAGFFQDGTHWREDSPYFGGAHALTRSAYLKVGGMEESFEGWGGEDYAMGFKLSRLTRNCRLQSWAVHLYHPPAGEALQKGTLQERNYFKYRLFKRQYRRKKDLCRYIRSSAALIS